MHLECLIKGTRDREQLITTQKQNNKKKKKQKQNKKNDTHHLSPPTQIPNINKPPPIFPIPPPIICSNNTMIKISLAQIRQSDGCESVKNDEIFNLHLGSGTGPRKS